jgi:glutamine amidotransferase
MKNIIIIDYNCGNILSIKRALNKMNLNSKLSRDMTEISNATHLILPGVGAFGSAMSLLTKYKLIEPIKKHVKKNKPLLGICLGMQLLLTKSFEFGEFDGLNFIEGTVEKITDQTKKKIKTPHIGWSEIYFEKEKKIFEKFDKKIFYFIHSYIAITKNKENTIAYTEFEDLKLPAIIKNKNIYGFQFHPEKSHTTGLELIKDFFEKIK